ncbi:cysteine hydrolase, partial [Pseudomonas aeruginosa]|nr:cysteine hydrolase [Pseudomonas aeruginosa]
RPGKFLACAQLLAALLMAPGMGNAAEDPYADPVKPALQASTFEWDSSRTALVVIDQQIDFMSKDGAGWAVFGESVTEQKLVPHLNQLFKAFKQ